MLIYQNTCMSLLLAMITLGIREKLLHNVHDLCDIYYCECRQNKELIKQLSSPSPGSKDLHFQSHFPRNGWEQFKACLWKQNLSYWRSPSYNLTRIFFVTASSLLFGVLFWKQGKQMLVDCCL